MKKNKGFSMVELIIVIAIMAILAGALAPALIKYINKSRISTDIQTGQTIATAIQTALANEKGFDCASDQKWQGSKSIDDVWATTNANDTFAQMVKDTVGGAKAPTVKSKNCVATGTLTGGNGKTGGKFYFAVKPKDNEVFVYIGDSSGTLHQVYPTADNCLSDDTTSTCDGKH